MNCNLNCGNRRNRGVAVGVQRQRRHHIRPLLRRIFCCHGAVIVKSDQPTHARGTRRRF